MRAQHSRQHGQRDGEPRQGRGDHGEARLLRGHGEDLLEVERDQDEGRGAGRPAEQRYGSSGAQHARPEELEGDQRVRGPALDGDERRHQDRRDGEQADDPRGGPGVVDGIDGTVHEGDHRPGHSGGARPVDGTPDTRRVLHQHSPGQGDGGQGHRNGHQEHGPPTHGAGEHSPAHDAGGSAQRRRSTPRPHRPGALCRREGDEQQGHGRRTQTGGTDPLDDAAQDQQLLGHRHCREEGSDCEQGRPDDEDAAATEQVCGPARQQQQPRKGEDVGIHDPGHGRRTEAELGLDRGQRDVHDRGVEHDEELRGHQQAERDSVPSRHPHCCHG